MKINQSVFIQDLLKEKNRTDCNFVNIPLVKVDSVIKINNTDIYKETNIKVYQHICNVVSHDLVT